jgi:hypothetical protein
MNLIKVIFLQSAANSTQSFQKGGEYELPLNEALSFIRAKIAIPGKVEIEKAIIPKKETRNVQDSHTTSSRANKPNRSKSVAKGKRNR